MKYKFLLFTCLIYWHWPCHVMAWDGFDADSADLVEIIPDNVPSAGEKITLSNRENDSMQECTVESVKRNRRTIELVVILPDGQKRMLVMEGR